MYFHEMLSKRMVVLPNIICDLPSVGAACSGKYSAQDMRVNLAEPTVEKDRLSTLYVGV